MCNRFFVLQIYEKWSLYLKYKPDPDIKEGSNKNPTKIGYQEVPYQNYKKFLNDTKHHCFQFKKSTIRIPTKMYNDAMTIDHDDPNIKNFSRFCEMLIWENLGMSNESKCVNQRFRATSPIPPSESTIAGNCYDNVKTLSWNVSLLILAHRPTNPTSLTS
jgi:hypothetical protein